MPVGLSSIVRHCLLAVSALCEVAVGVILQYGLWILECLSHMERQQSVYQEMRSTK
jgi:hypothetical protein